MSDVRLDLDGIERIARAASTQDEWQWRPGDPDVLEGKHDGQVVLSGDEDLETEAMIMASIGDRAHIAAASPPVVLALIARIRELEEWLRSAAAAMEFAAPGSVSAGIPARIREAIAKGVKR